MHVFSLICFCSSALSPGKKRRLCSSSQQEHMNLSRKMVMMDMVRPMVFALLAVFVFTTLVHAQDEQAGFISIDCGVSADYTDDSTGINYVSDTTFRETGVTGSISSLLKTATLATQLSTLRSFPNGTRNCYTLKPSRAASSKYLIRARFMYGNYDGLNNIPTFDLHLGTNTWATVEFVNAATAVSKEIIVNITSTYTYVCLANTGNGTPFISALELRPIKASTYEPKYGSLVLFRRFDFGSTLTHVIRYKEDIYDRLWSPFDWPELAYINTSLTVDADSKNIFQPPAVVMSTAVTPRNVSQPISFYWDPKDPTTEYYIYMHFAEVEKLEPNQTREFNITLNGTVWYEALRPTYLSTNTLYSLDPKSFDRFIFQLVRTENSTLPPIINALEIYEVNRLLQAPTSQEEVDAMKNIKSMYGVKKNWQGDPCAPQIYMWDRINCSFSGYDPPEITYLNLSSSGLTGEIPSDIANLKSLQILDLSNNNLNGSVPGFLTQLSSLRVLNLAKNKLSGSIPQDLIERSSNGLLSLSVEENIDLCASTSCTTSTEKKNEKKSNSVIVPIAASIAGVTIFILLVALAIWFTRKRRHQGGKVSTVMTNNRYSNEDESILEAKNRQVTYSDVESMTNNFDTVIGEGGFGTVYRGYFDGAQVAVKMLSPSSAQGYKEFHAEVKLLMRVHHRNLTSLVGYCDDSNHKALIYEYMVNGNLADHLSARSPNVLNWEERLRIAVDSAQGLEYLHNGCKPPIVHRDVKTTNILLNETFQAKIADFGLSRACPTEGGTHVSTVVAGTPGYLDPEYYISNRLNEKSDVFSFGVVILEIIAGRAVITRNQETAHISQWASNILEREGDVRNIVDSRLRGDFDVNSAWKAVEVAMACVSPTSAKRPTMTEAVMELKDCLAMETSRMNSRGTISSSSIDMASLSIDTGVSPLAR